MPDWLFGTILVGVVAAQLVLCWLLYTIAQGLMAALDRISHLSSRTIHPSRNGKDAPRYESEPVHLVRS